MQRNRLIAGTLTLFIAGALFWAGRRGGPRKADEQVTSYYTSAASLDEPAAGAEARLRQALEAARQGDVNAYLSSFGGTLRERTQRDVQERGKSAFADDLKKAAQGRKGHAIYAPEPDGPNAWMLTVESVYADHNERQTFRLERVADNWLIMAVQSARGDATRPTSTARWPTSRRPGRARAGRRARPAGRTTR